jgi:uncharacterized MAPEG superfamily protein
MKTERVYLLCCAILTGSLWIPVVIGYVLSRGLPTPEDYHRAPTSPLPDWVQRASRAHLNAVESFTPFAAVVLAAGALGAFNAVTKACAATFFYARVSNAAIHLSEFRYFMARTVVFTVAWIAFVVLAAEVLLSAFR